MDATHFGMLLRLHRELDAEARRLQGRDFLSGWQTTHPYASGYLPPDRRYAAASPEAYTFLSDSARLVEAVREFHLKTDGVEYPADAVYVSVGSSPLLSAFFLRLREKGIDTVCFVPPIYYSCYYFAQCLGVNLRRIGTVPLYRADADLRLPATRSLLVISDPIWVFGVNVRPDIIDEIRAWQDRTGSEVLVDGTFQYTRWGEGACGEASAGLHPERTFRIVCPTKSLAVHGVRFAYMLLPPDERESIRYPAANLTGATGTANELDALRLMAVLNSPDSNRELCRFIERRHRALHAHGVIVAEAVAPEAGYFTFARLDEKVAGTAVLMDQRYFGLEGFDGYVRVNLLHRRWQSLG